MSLIKKLASETAAYGLSSILARLINYIFSFIIVKAVTTAEYGDFTKFYAYAGFLQVVLTHGMETAYFRFKNKAGNHPQAFATGFMSMAALSMSFLLVSYIFQQPIAFYAKVAQNPEFVLLFAWIMAFDTLSALPFASLRAHNRPFTFAAFRIINIVINIIFILLLLFWLPKIYDQAVISGAFWTNYYNPNYGVGYVFIANLIASVVTFILMSRELKQLKLGVDFSLYKQMLPYALPIMLVGFAGMINEMLSRVMMEYLLPYDDYTNKELLGIFGFNYKFAMLITLFLQAYRYAAEPFFFANAENENAKEVYAKSMHYFIIAGCFIFLSVMVMIPFIQYMLLSFDPKYAEYFHGQNVIPILLAANLLLGIYFNLSTWYKVTDKTHIGAMISIFGATMTFVLNWIMIPKYGYTGAAVSTLLCYSSMVIVGYITELKYYPIPYYIKHGLFYIVLTVILWQIFEFTKGFFNNQVVLITGLSVVMLSIYLVVTYLSERGQLKFKRG
ncbi:MAG TPA: polysaccharide biosynthesis C-terminal domain-containing protein [Chitinophagales bacterium]|nr:polysaccharide biosynthesis C-terminal domain-containing protein [Chitinophagales bacterium]